MATVKIQQVWEVIYTDDSGVPSTHPFYTEQEAKDKLAAFTAQINASAVTSLGKFDIAMKTVLENEGGYVWDKNDPGGETNFGISKRSYPNVDIKNLTVEGARAIYLKDFWLFSGITEQAVCTKLMDMYVNAKHNAIKVAQRIVNADADGYYGPKTERLINQMDPVLFLNRFRNDMVLYYMQVAVAYPERAQYLKGWLKRARQ